MTDVTILHKVDGPMEREIIAEIAEMKPGRERGKKLMTLVGLLNPDEWVEGVDGNPPVTPPQGEWHLWFCKVMALVKEMCGFSDEQILVLVNDYDEALGKWWEKQLQ
jgi:hypothetical protein